MLQNFLKIAWRNLLKNKGTSFINIAGLSVGMAVAMMIGLWMHDELSFNKIHKHYDRLAQVWVHQTFNENTGSSEAVSLPVASELRNSFSSDFTDIARTSWNFGHVLAYGDKKIRKAGLWSEPALPAMLSLRMLQGDYENALKSPNSILMAASLAEALFGTADPMGKTIKVDNRIDVQVTGIFEDLPKNSAFHDTYFYLPWDLYLSEQEWIKNAMEQWDNHSFQLFVMVPDKTDMASLSKKIENIEKDHRKDVGQENPRLFLHPMERWHLYSTFKDGINTGGRIQYVRLFGIIGIFVLLLACINFMNLATARSERRAKEVGVRKAVGSVRGQLIGQFLTESMLVVFLALVFSIALVQLSLPWFNELSGKEVGLPLTQPLFWLALLGFSIFTGMVAGSYPAFYLSSFEPLKVLKGTHRSTRWATFSRQGLVVVQFTVSVVLIIGTLVVFGQINHAKNRPIGYDREGLLATNISTDLRGKYDALRNSLLETGAVEEMSQSSGPVTGIWANLIGFKWEGSDPNADPMFGFLACSHDYGNTIGWEILEGRDFSREHGTDTSAFILNEAAVELTGLENIVGKTIFWNDAPKQVIGVVKNMVMESPYMPVKPTIFSMNYDWSDIFNIRLKPGVPVQDALAKVSAVFKELDPASPFEYKFVDEVYDEKFRSEERIGKLARVFAILAIFISCLGLFGLSAYVAEQRTKEIGIRKVLGATVANLWAMQSKGFVALVVVSLLIAAPLAWYFLKNWLMDYEYRIALRWQVFALSGLMAVAVTLLTVSFQSVKAALANPVKSLRSE